LADDDPAKLFREAFITRQCHPSPR
jgi:hypothetical protein